ncbi:Guanine nucleotide-binding protein-like 3 [Allomyces arbusculus]|nr:Guanine nucleotide-binding protein-like 3 [Allomyces arbusculus]
MVAKQHKSKRVTCRQKYKIQRKIREHDRKVRKAAKKNPKSNKPRKDPGIPNLWPFKDEMLAQIDAAKQREVAKQAEIRQRRAELKKQQQAASKSAAPKKPSASAKAAAARATSVTDLATVFVHVLDARDPLGSRAAHVEEALIAQGKRVVLVLNKADLVPKDIVKQWLALLRTEAPTMALSAKTPERPLGAPALLALLRAHNATSVGVIGYPNVGKSSVINALKGLAACPVSPTPNLTKSVAPIPIDSSLTLLDGPALAPPAGGCALLARNCTLRHAHAAIIAVQVILARASRASLMMLYNLPQFKTPVEFLSRVAAARLRRNVEEIQDEKVVEQVLVEAAQLVVKDWHAGKLPFYIAPPDLDESVADEMVAQVVDVEELDKGLSGLKTAKELGKDFVVLDLADLPDDDDDDDEEEMDGSDEDMDEIDEAAASDEDVDMDEVSDEEMVDEDASDVYVEPAPAPAPAKTKKGGKQAPKPTKSTAAKSSKAAPTASKKKVASDDSYDFGEFSWGA